MINKKILAEQLLQDIYQKTSRTKYINMDALMLEFGTTEHRLRPILEDLKDNCLIIEHDEGFQISPQGINYSKTRWI